MPYTYPVAPTTNGTFTIADLQNSISNASVFAHIMNQALGLDETRYITYALLSGRFQLEGQTVIYPYGDPTLPDSVETVTPGAEYPYTTLTPGQIQTTQLLKRGHSTLITDEALKQQGREAIIRAGNLLAGSLIRDFDRIGIGALRSVIPTTAASASWADAKTFLTDLLNLKAAITAKGDGMYVPDSLVLSEASYAKLLPNILDILPRESDVVTGAGWATIQGVTIMSNPHASELTNPILLDSRTVGGIATGNVDSPGYAKIGTVAEVQTIREARNDAWTIQARTIALPVITNPGAGLQITGTDL